MPINYEQRTEAVDVLAELAEVTARLDQVEVELTKGLPPPEALSEALVLFLCLLQPPIMAVITRLQQDRMLHHRVVVALRGVQRSAQGPLTACLAQLTGIEESV